MQNVWFVTVSCSFMLFCRQELDRASLLLSPSKDPLDTAEIWYIYILYDLYRNYHYHIDIDPDLIIIHQSDGKLLPSNQLVTFLMIFNQF